MKNFDWKDYKDNKKVVFSIIIVLSIIAFLMINNSINVVRNQWLDDIQSTIDDNVQKIGLDVRELVNNLHGLSSIKQASLKEQDLVKVSAKDKEILNENSSLIYDMKIKFFTNAQIYSKKLKDSQMALLNLNEFKSIVEKNKYVHDYDKLIKEIDDAIKSVSVPGK